MPYAQGTVVPVDRSRSEIERQLVRFKAEGFAYGWDGGQEIIGFMYAGKQVRMSIPMPSRGSYRSEESWQQERRRRWRALAMVVKAKLVAVEDGIISFEDEFLSYFVLPNGSTLGQVMIPRLDAAAESGDLPPLLLSSPRGHA